jgi:hypothetical protein
MTDLPAPCVLAAAQGGDTIRFARQLDEFALEQCDGLAIRS